LVVSINTAMIVFSIISKITLPRNFFRCQCEPVWNHRGLFLPAADLWSAAADEFLPCQVSAENEEELGADRVISGYALLAASGHRLEMSKTPEALASG
jgi:hypothetical protein